MLQWHPLATFTGLAGVDGRAVSGDAHLKASIRDILTTPVGTRVFRRSYGSRLFDLLDQPFGPGLIAEIVAATAEALEAWEPRIDVKRVSVRAGASGKIEIDLTYVLATREAYADASNRVANIERVLEDVA